MRHIIRIAAAATLGVLGFLPGAPLLAQQGYVHEVSGDVSGHVGLVKPAPVEKGMTLPTNSTITTGPKSYSVLKFEDGTVILLKENTSFQLQAYNFQPEVPETANAVFNLLRGGLRLVTGVITSRNREALRVATPLATIGIRGTDFTAELTNPLFVGVQAGAVSLSNAAGTLLVPAGQFASVGSLSQLATMIEAAQVPPGALQFPNVALPPATPLPAAPVGASIAGGAAATTGGGLGIGAAAVAAGAIAAGIAASNRGSDSTSQHQ